MRSRLSPPPARRTSAWSTTSRRSPGSATARDVWLHVDGAYGGAALAAPSARAHFAGVEHADSFIVDPHKWLFAPFDCVRAALSRPALTATPRTHTTRRTSRSCRMDNQWNPSDYAIHLTRRARGLPFWFSLAAHGTKAYADSVEQTLTVTRAAGALIDAAEHLELLVEPTLSVVAFRRRGWQEADYVAWSARLLRDGAGLVVPSAHNGEPMLRLCIVNPRTTAEDIAAIIASLR